MSTMFQGVEKDSAAFRLMQQMGWEEGSGLGKHKQGMKEHLRVRQKQDNTGIGIDQKMKAQTLWKVNTMEYDSVLKKLKVIVGQAGEVVDEEDLKKKVSGGAEASQNEELKVIKATRPQGRYKNREKGKMVGSYSTTDLAAILGEVQGKSEIAPGTQTHQLRKVRSHSILSTRVESSDVSSDDVEEDLGPASKRVCRAKVEPEFEFEDLPEDWWGNKFGFVRAGKLGASSAAVKTERTVFREKDQEDFAILAAEKATKGKQGLGAADRMRVSKGAGWKGKKKALGSDSDEDDDNEEEFCSSDQKQSITDTRCENDVKMEAQTPTEETLKEKSASGVCDGTIKIASRWRKVCEQLLREAPAQTLSLKRLEKRFCSTMLLACGLEVQLDRAKLQKSSRFVVDGKRVTLASA